MFYKIGMGGNGISKSYFPYIIRSQVDVSEQSDFGLSCLIHMANLDGFEIPREERIAAVIEYKHRADTNPMWGLTHNRATHYLYNAAPEEAIDFYDEIRKPKQSWLPKQY